MAVCAYDRIGSGQAHAVLCNEAARNLLWYPPVADSVIFCMQGMILALEALAAAGSQMVGTSQGGAKEKTRHEAFRDEETLEMEDMPAFEKYLEGVRKQGECFIVPSHVCNPEMLS